MGSNSLTEDDIKSFSKYLNLTLNNPETTFLLDTSMFSPYSILNINAQFFVKLNNNSLKLEERTSYAKRFILIQTNYNYEMVSLVESNKNVKFTDGVGYELKGLKSKLNYFKYALNFFLENNKLDDSKEIRKSIKKLDERFDETSKLIDNPGNLFVPDIKRSSFNKQLKKRVSRVSKNLEERIRKKISKKDTDLVYTLFNENLSGNDLAVLSRDGGITRLCNEVIESHKLYIEDSLKIKLNYRPLICKMPRYTLNYCRHDVSTRSFQ
ncbi:hypothetical protein JYT44_02285 [Caldithrix abyssi]|nr:hypothetical protein [Caldithrix abyssi]